MTHKANGQPIRCAVCTRKSTDEGLEKDFNSLDAQREAGEAYITSQRHEGWICLATAYDDGGYNGANLDRPALQRLLADIEAAKIDCVVVYKVDRLSRSLMDFSRLLETFDKHAVSFVSVTQSFNTNTSIGRLTLNMLLSFAQFERETISQRTRDKVAAARRKGMWSGGRPVLGYDVVDRKLVVNEAEASRVRQIFALYIELGTLIPTVKELERRGWRTKRWTAKDGSDCGGRPFDKGELYNLLTNVIYVGQVRHREKVYPGQHAGIIDSDVFDRVQSLLRRNHRTGGAEMRNQYGALLKGLLRCTACDCAMTHTHTKKGSRRYRYYVCVHAQKRGWDACPSKSIPAGEIERFIVDQIRCIGGDPGLLSATLALARQQADAQIVELDTERQGLVMNLGQYHAEIRGLLAQDGVGSDRTTARLADLQERIRSAELRLPEIDQEIESFHGQLVDESELTEALAAFEPVWEQLSLREQSRVLQLLIERVDYDGRTDDIVITFHPTGIRTLVDQIAQQQETAA